MPKDACVACGERIPKYIEYYSRYGNYCKGCNMRCLYVATGVLDKSESDRALQRKKKELTLA